MENDVLSILSGLLLLVSLSVVVAYIRIKFFD